MIPPHQSLTRQLPPKGKPPLQSAPSSNVASDFNAILVVIHCKGNFAKRLPLGGKLSRKRLMRGDNFYPTIVTVCFLQTHITNRLQQFCNLSPPARICCRCEKPAESGFFVFHFLSLLSTVNCQLSSHRAESALTLRKGLLWQTNSSSRAESPLWAKFRSAA